MIAGVILLPKSGPMQVTAAKLLLLSKQQEIEALRTLESRSSLVATIGSLVHALQNERGATSIFLASGGERFQDIRRDLAAESGRLEHLLRKEFGERVVANASGTARLYSLVAWVLLGIDDLPALRGRIKARRLSGDDAIRSISRLIAGLLSVIFEIADTAITPEVSRSLVALFNLLNGKELAGQERAIGALSFASGRSDAGHQQRLIHLIDAQERNFQLFMDFAAPDVIDRWRELESSPCVARLERLRRILCSTRPDEPLDAETSDQWFEICSERLTGLWSLQCSMVGTLQHTCSRLIAEARRDLADAEGLLERLVLHPPASADRVDRFFDPKRPIDMAMSFSPDTRRTPESMEQSIIDVLQAQSVRLASVESELQAARRALDERKLIERAKGVLMARLGVSEEKAYKALRDASMTQNRRMADVAEATLALPDFVGAAGKPHQE